MTPIPLEIEDRYVRDYLWDRALIAIDDPCTRSHPHENMDAYCQHKTELVRRIAQEPDPYDEVQIAYGLPKREWVGLTDEEMTEIRLSQERDDLRTSEMLRKAEAKLKEKNT